MGASSRKRIAAGGAALVAALLACYTPSPPGGTTPIRGGRLETEQAGPGLAGPAGELVSAGVSGQYFTTYTITVAPNWSYTRESDPARPLDKLTVTWQDYTLVIVQGGAGIEGCYFGGEPTPTGLAHLWQEYPAGMAITGASAEFMRGTADGTSHTVCQKQDGVFKSVTPFGGIYYTTPNPADPSRLAEMDGMVASLTR